jgi:hypothetical protein
LQWHISRHLALAAIAVGAREREPHGLNADLKQSRVELFITTENTENTEGIKKKQTFQSAVSLYFPCSPCPPWFKTRDYNPERAESTKPAREKS